MGIYEFPPNWAFVTVVKFMCNQHDRKVKLAMACFLEPYTCMYTYSYKLPWHPAIHCFTGSAPVGVQCPLIYFLSGWVSRLLGLALWSVVSRAYTRVARCPCIAFPFAFPYLGVFPFTLLHLPLNFIISSLYDWCIWILYPSVYPSHTHFLGEFPRRLGKGSGTCACWGLRGGSYKLAFN